MLDWNIRIRHQIVPVIGEGGSKPPVEPLLNLGIRMGAVDDQCIEWEDTDERQEDEKDIDECAIDIERDFFILQLLVFVSVQLGVIHSFCKTRHCFHLLDC